MANKIFGLVLKYKIPYLRHDVFLIQLNKSPFAFSQVRSISDPYNYNDPHGWYRSRIGNREVVGFGINGEPEYADRTEFPFPSIRYSQPTSDFLALREKEKGDWRLLSLEEKKTIYRLNFCQTYAEMNAPTGEWMVVVGGVFILISIGLWLYILMRTYVYSQYPLPSSFSASSRRAQLKRMLQIRTNPITGISSRWDYENHRWKSRPWYIPWEDPFSDDDNECE